MPVDMDRAECVRRLIVLTILLRFKDKLLKTIETDKEVITIGRNAYNDIQIDNLSVSKRHAKITHDKGGYCIEDLNSTNGTYLNEKKISKGRMNHRDVVTIGKHTLEFHLDKMSSTETSQEGINDTMMLTTEKHKRMLARQKKRKRSNESGPTGPGSRT